MRAGSQNEKNMALKFKVHHENKQDKRVNSRERFLFRTNSLMSLDLYADELSCRSYICFTPVGFTLGMLEGVLKCVSTILHHHDYPSLLCLVFTAFLCV